MNILIPFPGSQNKLHSPSPEMLFIFQPLPLSVLDFDPPSQMPSTPSPGRLNDRSLRKLNRYTLSATKARIFEESFSTEIIKRLGKFHYWRKKLSYAKNRVLWPLNVIATYCEIHDYYNIRDVHLKGRLRKLYC